MELCITILLLEYIFSLIFTSFSWRRISQSEIRNSAAAESEGGQKFLSPLPPPRSGKRNEKEIFGFASPYSLLYCTIVQDCLEMQYLLCYNYVDESEIRREYQEDTHL